MQRNIQSPSMASGTEAEAPLVTMEVDIPKSLAGLMIGKNGGTVNRFEKDTGARVQIKAPEGESGRTYVAARGSIEQVDNVFKEVKLEVAKFDSTIAEQLQRILKDVKATKPDVLQWDYKRMAVQMTLALRKDAFKSLFKKKGEMLNTLRWESQAIIKTEDNKDAKDSRHVTIQGAIDDVANAAQKIKDLSQRHDPDQGSSQKQSSIDRMDLMVIKAKANIKFPGLAAGYMIGTNGQHIKRMKEESHVQFLDVDNNEDEEGFKTVNVSGYVSPVLDAIQRVQESMKNYCEKVAKPASAVEVADDLQTSSSELSVSLDSQQTDPMETETQSAMPITPQPYPPFQPASNVSPPDLGQEIIVYDRCGNTVRLIREADGRYKPVLDVVPQLLFTQTNIGTTPESSLNPTRGAPPGFATCAITQQQRNTLANDDTGEARQSLAQMSLQASATGPAPKLSFQ